MTAPGRADAGRRRRWSFVAAGLVLVVVAVIAVVALTNGTSSRPGAAVSGAVRITSFDGVGLDAEVTRPAGTGKHPLVVMASSYDANKTEYAAVARSLTASGFVTVSYTQRGFDRSGGDIDLAGKATQRDARSVIDWALRRTSADPKRIGMLGVSYGAGIALLTAAHDARVRAVVALSTWTDLAEAFRPNRTLSLPGLGGLLTKTRAAGELRTLADRLRSDPLGSGASFVAFAKSRSPATYLSQLNRNKPAVMLANGWQDSLFPPTMLVDFYRALRTPKRLQLSSGDHVGPERDLLAGRPSRLGDDSLAWLRHYLSGQRNGIDGQPPVQLEDVATKTTQIYRNWPASTSLSTTLAPPSTSAVAISQAPSVWTATVGVGQDSAATAGQSQSVPGDQFRSPTVALRTLPPDRSLVWAGPPLARPTRVVGTPRLTLGVSSSAPNASLFIYLYDAAPDGTATLMTLTPLTVPGTTSTPKPVSIDLEPIDRTLAAGHQLAVVADTVDARWYQAAPPGATITVSSTSATPAGLRVPLG